MAPCQTCEPLFSFTQNTRYSRNKRYHAYLSCPKHLQTSRCPLLVYNRYGEIEDYVTNFRWVTETLIKSAASITEDMNLVFLKMWRRVRKVETRLLILEEIARKAKSGIVVEPWTVRSNYYYEDIYNCPKRVVNSKIKQDGLPKRSLIEELVKAATQHIDYQEWSVYLSALPSKANFWAERVKKHREEAKKQRSKEVKNYRS